LSSPQSPYIAYKYPEGYAIIPRNTAAEQEAISTNLDYIAASSLTGAKEHFNKAIEALSATEPPKYADVVREAVHAVESAICVIADKPKAALSE
jgi:hypothetical protein